MIKFDLSAMSAVKDQLDQGFSALEQIDRLGGFQGAFSTAPSLQSSFSQQMTFLAGQSGSVSVVIEDLRRDIEWLKDIFVNHVEAFQLQDQLAAGSFGQMNSTAEFNQSMFKIRQANRDFKPISNLLYTQPVTVVEAGTPLVALIAMFEGHDGAPMQAAAEWGKAGAKLMSSMTALQAASTGLSASAEGYSFDMARSAIDDVAKAGHIVGANAALMGQSMMEFPAVRLANLNALLAIQASTAAIPDPAARIAAEQSAVATFASTQLQPSLELLRPPVSNLGIPVAGHSGGGSLDGSTTSQSSGVTQFHTPQGGTMNVSTADTQGLANQAQAAANAAPQPTGAVTPANAAGATPHMAGQTPAHAVQANVPTAAGAPSGVAASPENLAATRPSGLGTGTSAPGNAINEGVGGRAEGVRGGVGQTNNVYPQQPGTRGPVTPQLPRAVQRMGTPSAEGRIGQVRGAMGGMPGLGKTGSGSLGIGGQQIDGSNKAGSFGGSAGNGNNAHGVNGGTSAHGATSANGAAGKNGSAMAGGAGGRGGMMGIGAGGAQGKGKSGVVNSRNAKAAAGIFGKGQWSPSVNEYFKRQFLGSKKKTVKEVIR